MRSEARVTKRTRGKAVEALIVDGLCKEFSHKKESCSGAGWIKCEFFKDVRDLTIFVDSREATSKRGVTED